VGLSVQNSFYTDNPAVFSS